MTSKITRLAMAVALAWSVPTPVTAAAVRCAPHKIVTSMLADQFQEQREAIGLSEAGLLMEVFASQSGTWTILLTAPGGVACIIAAGDNFEEIVPPLPEA